MSREIGLSVADETTLELEPWLEPFFEVGDRGLGNARARCARAQKDSQLSGVRPVARMRTTTGLLTTTLDPSIKSEE